jgi:hypothetical protein
MLRKSIFVAVVLCLAACQQQSPPAPAASAPAAKPAPAPTAPAAAPAAASATADSIGVPECDEYLNKYQACVDNKVPEAARASFKQSLDQTRAAWRTAAANPGGKEGMAAACKQARDAAKTSMSPYGCSDF